MPRLTQLFIAVSLASAVLKPIPAGAAEVGAAVRHAASPRLAYVGTDYNIHECTGDCTKPVCLTCAVAGVEARGPGPYPALRLADLDQPEQEEQNNADFGWPTYSPDGRRLAYVSSSSRKKQASFGVYVYDLDKRIATKVFESPTERAIYLFWLRDGKRLSFLVTEPDDKLSLMMAEVRDGAPVRIVATGLPLYFDWGRKEGELVLHTTVGASSRGEHVSLMNLTPTSQDVVRVLAHGYSPFKTPCWSPDGAHLAFVTAEDDISHLYVADPDGKNPKAAARLLVGQSSFVWAPDSRHIAFSTAQLPPHTVMDGISLLDLADGSVRRVVNDDVAAFYFSPDSRQIAYVAVPLEQPFFTWNVIDLQSGRKRKLASLLATNEETIAWHYFEQLALSHSIWAPDSSAIVVAGVSIAKEPRPGAPEMPMHTPPPSVTIVPVDGRPPHRVAEGVLAFWSPAP